MAENFSDFVDAQELAELLSGTLLEGRLIRTVSSEDGERSALIIGCDSSEAFDAWKVCRELVDRTRRWPVMTGNWGDHLLLDNELQTSFEPVMDTSPLLTSWARSAVELEWQDICRGLFIDLQASGAPTLTSALSKLGEGATLQDLRNWAFRWQLQRDQIDTSPDKKHNMGEWSALGDPPALVLLPVTDSWNSISYLSIWACVDRQSRCAALLRSWHERFGAEIWANNSVVLELTVERPPTDVETAWTLAAELYQIGPLRQAATDLEQARALIGRDRWNLYDRP